MLRMYLTVSLVCCPVLPLLSPRSIRRKRIEEMRARAQKEQQWRAQGHLEYQELRDEKE